MNDIKHTSEADATELLPCPFCGKQPNYVAFGADKHQIDCDEDERCLAVVGTPTMRTKSEAAIAWNTRATPTLHPASASMKAACEAAEQCIVDFLDVYKRGCSMLILDEAVKSLRDDALAKARAALAEAKGLAA